MSNLRKPPKVMEGIRVEKNTKDNAFIFLISFYILYLILELSSVSFLHDPSSSLNYKGKLM